MTQLTVSRVRDKIPVDERAKRWRQKKEDLHLKNLDQHSSHDIDVVIRTDGSVVHRGEYHLLPGQSGCSVNLVPAGRYTVTACVDETDRATTELRVSDHRDRTICIEVEPSSVDVRQGI